jgi:hypothetical protein
MPDIEQLGYPRLHDAPPFLTTAILDTEDVGLLRA